MFQTINPVTGDVIKTYHYLSFHETQARIEQAEQSFRQWREVPVAERADVLKKLAAHLRNAKNELAQLMNQEMGKSLSEGLSEIEKCADCCEHFAAVGPGLLKPQPVTANYPRSEIRFEPQGVIFSIMPWNFPFWQFIRFAAPSLMVGNVILLKHSNVTAGCGEKIEELCHDLFPVPLVYNLRIDHAEAAHVIRNPHVRGVTFTGSTRGGREVAKVAGEALKKTVMELGGSDAYLILADADIEKAAKVCAKARMINNGQSCIAAKRFIVHKDVYEKFVKQLKAELSSFPAAPLAAVKFQFQLQEQVEKLKAWGGRVLLGGSLPAGVGAYYPPSLIVFESPAPEVHQEEVFGPVALVFRAEGDEEAMAMANASPFGLGGGLFSAQVARTAEWGSKHMESGFVVVNDFVRSDARLPFGGVKDSGYGRELAHFGFYEFCNIKTLAWGSEF